MIYQCIDIETVYLYVQYFMTDAVVVYYHIIIMVTSFTALQLFSAYNYFGKSSYSHFTVSYNISLYRDTKSAIYCKLCIITPLVHTYITCTFTYLQ